MLNWLLRSKNALPSYSLLDQVPSRCVPQELVRREDSEDYRAWRDRVQADLFASPTDPNSPHFAIFLKRGEGLLQLPHPEEKGNYLLAFSSPYKAADYARVQVPYQKFEFFSSSPAQAVQLIPHFHQYAGITHVALDRCPRCPSSPCSTRPPSAKRSRSSRLGRFPRPPSLAVSIFIGTMPVARPIGRTYHGARCGS